MSTKKECHECKQWLEPHATECECGWKHKTPLAKADYRCSFIFGDAQRCGRNGTVTLQLRGSTWYCSQHLHQVMRDIEKQHQEIFDKQSNQEKSYEKNT